MLVLPIFEDTKLHIGVEILRSAQSDLHSHNLKMASIQYP